MKCETKSKIQPLLPLAGLVEQKQARSKKWQLVKMASGEVAQGITRKAGIYAIINNKTGKRYIGQTNNFSFRKGKHIGYLRSNSHINPHLQRAFNLDGEESFEFTILEVVVDGDINAAEVRWIAMFNSDNPEFGYNCTSGGKYAPLNRAALDAISKKLSGRPLAPEHRAKISASNKGRIISAESRRRLSVTLKAKYDRCEMPWFVPTYFSGEQHGMFGKTHTPEARAKISSARMGKTYYEVMSKETADRLIAQRKAMVGDKNPNYIHVDLEAVISRIQGGEFVEDIVKSLAISKTQLHYKFKRKYNCPPVEYVNKLKYENCDNRNN